MLIFTLLIGWILCGAEMDIFVPSLPELQDVFGISPFIVELTIALNCIAHFIAALFVGSLGDKFGYRPVILWGTATFLIGSLFCTFAGNYHSLLLGRFLQGGGIATTTTLAYLILTNIYSVEKQQVILGWLNGVITIAMTAAPIIGSYVALVFGWRGNFIILLMLSLINFIFSYYFIPYQTPAGNASISLREYKKIFSSRKTVYYIFSITFAIVPYWIFIAISPILYMDSFGVKLEHFGFYQGAMALIFSILSFSNSWMISKFGTKKPSYLAIVCFIIFLISDSYIIYFNITNPIIITASMVVLSIGCVIPCNILYPLMFEILPESKGKTSAALTALRMLLTASGIQFASYFYDGTFFMLGITLSILVSLSLFYTYKLMITEGEIIKLH